MGLTRADIDYICTEFVPLDDLCRKRGDDPRDVRAEIAARRLPKPSYVLEDGTEMVPSDYFALVDEAGGVAGIHDLFVARYTAAASVEREPLDDADLEWDAFLSGEYGVCLRSVTPESIVRKSALVQRIERLLAHPDPDRAEWRSSLRVAVDELDRLERQFAPYDRVRFGGPVSRDRLIDGARERFPDVFAREPAA